MVDEMHCLFLGVFQTVVLCVLWAAVAADCWNVGAGLTEDARANASAFRIRHDLFQWYKARVLCPTDVSFMCGR